MSELVTTTSVDPTGGRLIAWAHAAGAAGELASQLVRTQIVPETFRVGPATPPAQADLIVGNAAAAILLGDELGLSPIAALRSLYVIRGQVGTYTRAKVALVKSRGHSIWTESETDTAVTVVGHRAGEPDHLERSTWTIERARAAGFMRRGRNGELSQYETQPRTMLYARAAGEVASRVAPDVLLGIPEDADEPSAPGGITPTVTVSRRSPRPLDSLGDPAPSGESQPTGEDGDLEAGPDPQTTPEDAASALPVTGDPESPEQPNDDVEPGITPPQLRLLQTLFVQVGVRGPDARHRYLSKWLGHPVTSTSDITVTEASEIIDRLQAQIETGDDDRRDR